jgi:hypothetical protein
MPLIPPRGSSELPPQPPAVAAASTRITGGSAFLRLFYSVDQSLDKIASMVPSEAEAVDKLKNQAKDLLTKILASGVNPQSEPPQSSISFGRPL